MDCMDTRLPCPLPSPGTWSNLCLLSQWCHLTILSSVLPPLLLLSSSFPSSGSFPVSQFFPSGVQRTGASASAPVLLMNIQDWFPLGLTGLISLQSKGLSRVFSNTTVQSINSSMLSHLYGPTLISTHDYWENRSFDHMDFCWQSNVSAFFNMLSRFVIAFLPRSKRLILSWL